MTFLILKCNVCTKACDWGGAVGWRIPGCDRHIRGKLVQLIGGGGVSLNGYPSWSPNEFQHCWNQWTHNTFRSRLDTSAYQGGWTHFVCLFWSSWVLWALFFNLVIKECVVLSETTVKFSLGNWYYIVSVMLFVILKNVHSNSFVFPLVIHYGVILYLCRKSTKKPALRKRSQLK